MKFTKAQIITLCKDTSLHKTSSWLTFVAIGVVFAVILVSACLFACYSCRRAHKEEEEARLAVAGRWKEIGEVQILKVPTPPPKTRPTEKGVLASGMRAGLSKGGAKAAGKGGEEGGGRVMGQKNTPHFPAKQVVATA